MEIRIIGVPVYQGCNMKGVELAPDTLRVKGAFDGLKEHFKVVDQGNISLLETSEETMLSAHSGIKYYDAIVDMSSKICKIVEQNSREGAFSIVVGGDHSVGAGSVAGSSIANNHNIGVVWFDAHADMNTPLTSPSKNYHGMPLATSMYVGPKELRSLGVDKRKVKPTDTFLVGVRCMDPGENEFKDTQGVNHYTISFIRKRGMAVVADEIIETLRKSGIEKIHFSFDLDSLSPEVTKAYNCPVPDGIVMSELITFIEHLFGSGKVCSMDFTEYNPLLDEDGKGMEVCKTIFDTIGKSIK